MERRRGGLPAAHAGAEAPRAREARKALGDLGWAGVEFGKDMPATEFIGYDEPCMPRARSLAIVAGGRAARASSAPAPRRILVLDQTPFYAEMGGQVADHGVIADRRRPLPASATYRRTRAASIMHYGTRDRAAMLEGGRTRSPPPIDAEPPPGHHAGPHRHPSAATRPCRRVLGDHVHQAGSLVEPDRLRFDFTHFSAMTPEELARSSRLVNEPILEGYPRRRPR